MLDWVEVIIRSVLIILGLFFITKLLGKKQLSKLSFFEYIVGITVGDIAGTISMDIELNVVNGVISLLIWALFPVIVSMASLKSIVFRKIVEGTPTTFIEGGKILEENLKHEKYTTDELMEQLRKKDIFFAGDVEFATLETNGELSVFLKREKKPVLWEDLFGQGQQLKTPQTIIRDGKLNEEAIYASGYSLDWVNAQLKKHEAAAEEIFLGQVDHSGKLYLDYYKDGLLKKGEKDIDH
ncbi:membrane protein [Bacillus sp. SA1-12]|uniref:DUF421 domain-containing protein n=1 Tax=Bacillus sp. SA1-12 TaxID=1455638 RepID=UPI0006267B0A|nr:DUF421 domain-containing protein [Bacillus sp. SA1-12]KKI93668.1 membrane protein [Bacillus sp. SA1-12]